MKKASEKVIKILTGERFRMEPEFYSDEKRGIFDLSELFKQLHELSLTNLKSFRRRDEGQNGERFVPLITIGVSPTNLKYKENGELLSFNFSLGLFHDSSIVNFIQSIKKDIPVHDTVEILEGCLRMAKKKRADDDKSKNI